MGDPGRLFHENEKGQFEGVMMEPAPLVTITIDWLRFLEDCEKSKHQIAALTIEVETLKEQVCNLDHQVNLHAQGALHGN